MIFFLHIYSIVPSEWYKFHLYFSFKCIDSLKKFVFGGFTSKKNVSKIKLKLINEILEIVKIFVWK